VKQYDVAWDENAVKTLNRIFHFIMLSQSEKRAKKLKKKLVTLGDSLRTFPERFPKEKLLEDIPGNFRSVTSGYYKLIYAVGADEVIIAGIFDTRQDPQKLIELFE